MDSTKIVGREAERSRLDKCMADDEPQLVIVYGRRRVGKTYLVSRYFGGRFDFKITGAYEQTRDEQLNNFIRELNRQSGERHDTPKSWGDAFELLRNHLESLPAENKRVIFFDEMPWLDTPKSGFLKAFEWFWNDWGSVQDNLICIVCGSSTSWMVENIAENKGGLFNRHTCRLYLQPFTLGETEEYLKNRGILWSRYDMTECYMVLGGIPYYLKRLDPDLSYRENIDNLFFRKRAELWDEFDLLYRTLFKNSDQYIKLAETLSRKRMGMTRQEIESATGIANGVLTKALNNLIWSGFVRACSFYNHKKRETLYQLSDYYSLFYFKFIKDNYGRDEHFWINTLDNPSRRSWAGLTFEQVCKDHTAQIKRSLSIAGVLSEESVWFVRKSSCGDGGDSKGAQIDMLIDRRDQTVNICEIKFSVNEYEIDEEYERKLKNKIERFVQDTGCRKTIQLTMITTYGVKRNMHSGIVSNQVTMDDLFA